MNPKLIVIFIYYSSYAFGFTPLTKEEQLERFRKVQETVEPFRLNLTECGRQVRASASDVDSFLRQLPQTTMEGKCLVACVLKRTGVIKANKIDKAPLVKQNSDVYGPDSEAVKRLVKAIDECSESVKEIFEICEYASVFNDCMHIKMEHVLQKLSLERKMSQMEEMAQSEFNEDEEDMVRLYRDEL